MRDEARQEVERLLEPAVAALGFELVDVELNLSRGRGTLRLFIDAAAGIGLDDCEMVSREVSAILDVEDPIPGEYVLEVSSPGMDRKLVKAEHFDRFAGSEVRVRTKRPLDGRRKFRGVLLRRAGDDIVVRVDNVEISIPIAEIEVARLVPEFV